VRSHSREKRPIRFAVFVALSVRLFACNSPAPTGRIYIKFYSGNFYDNMSRQSKFNKNRTRISANTIQNKRNSTSCNLLFLDFKLSPTRAHQPVASTWVAALHYLLYNRTHPYLIYWLRPFSSQAFFSPYKYPLLTYSMEQSPS
jgi:hypothetical protein